MIDHYFKDFKYTVMKIFSTLVFTVIICYNSFSQFDGYNTYYYNYTSNLAYSNEIAESVAADSLGNFYVAGERSKDLNEQDVRLIKYPQSGFSTSVNFANQYYKEYVKKVMVKNSSVYVICNAVTVSSNVSYMLIIRYNASLQFLGSVLFLESEKPTDAEFDDAGNLFVSCYRKNDSTGFAVIKLSPSLATISIFAYNYKNNGDLYLENPNAMYYNYADKSIYVAGDILNTALKVTATLLLKLDAATNTQQWKRVSSFTPGKNTYSDVRTSSKRVYAIGTKTDVSNTRYLNIQGYNYAGKSPLTYTYNDTVTSYQTEGFKISFASANQVNFTGITKDSVNSKCNIILGVLSDNLGLPYSIYNLAMPYNTTLSDAVTNQNSLYNLITGSKKVGTNQYMFLYGYAGSKFSININYKDSISNRSAAGNSIAFRSPYYACVAGYQDTKPNSFQPHDYQFFTRIYYDDGIGFASGSKAPLNATAEKNTSARVRVFPNPAQHYISIESSEAIHDIIVTDIKGSIIISRHFSEASKLQTLDISNFAAGVYMLSINSGKSYQIVKQ
jgi:hypothetical protein